MGSHVSHYRPKQFHLYFSLETQSKKSMECTWLEIALTSFHHWGLGVHPHEDPWNRPFTNDYCPDRWMKAGHPLSGPFTYVLDGIQGDADFIASMFQLNRPWSKHICKLNLFISWWVCRIYSGHPWNGQLGHVILVRKLPTSRMLLSLQSHRISKWSFSRRRTIWFALYSLGPRCVVSIWATLHRIQSQSPWHRSTWTSKVCFDACVIFVNLPIPANLGNAWSIYCSCFPSIRFRLTTDAEFVAINGATPITTIRGFSAWRIFGVQSSWPNHVETTPKISNSRDHYICFCLSFFTSI